VRVPSATEPQSGTLWKGHSRPVTAVALSADDTRAAAASKDGVVLLYDVETGARTRLPQAPPVPTQNVRVSRSRVARHLSMACCAPKTRCVCSPDGRALRGHVRRREVGHRVCWLLRSVQMDSCWPLEAWTSTSMCSTSDSHRGTTSHASLDTAMLSQA
jgi:WD40 repeat protein